MTSDSRSANPALTFPRRPTKARKSQVRPRSEERLSDRGRRTTDGIPRSAWKRWAAEYLENLIPAATVIVGILVATVLFSDRTPSGVAEITTTPSGATVRIDDHESTYPTPLRARVRAGDHRFIIEHAGYATQELMLEVPPGDDPVTRTVRLEPVGGQ